MRYRGEYSALRRRSKVSWGHSIAFLRDLAQRSLGNFTATTYASARDEETRDVIVGALILRINGLVRSLRDMKISQFPFIAIEN